MTTTFACYEHICLAGDCPRHAAFWLELSGRETSFCTRHAARAQELGCRIVGSYDHDVDVLLWAPDGSRLHTPFIDES